MRIENNNLVFCVIFSILVIDCVQLMKFRFIYFVFIVLFLVACSGNRGNQFEHSGGSLKVSTDEFPSSFVPSEVIDAYSSRILRQVYDGLVSIDPRELSIQPRIAQSWSISSDGQRYDFVIRKNVLFHSAENFESESDRTLTPQDIVFTVEKICKKETNSDPRNAYFFAFHDLLDGAKEYYEGTAKSIAGLKISGDTVSFFLTREDRNFLYKMANVSISIESKKANELGIKTPLGTGPFQFGEQNSSESIILTKNNNFYLTDENQKALPYLDSLIFKVEGRKLEQLRLFEENKIDIIQELPASRITKMLEGNIEAFNSVPPKLILENNALLETNSYFFNLNDERFQDVRVRKAFNYAINRKSIGINILRNQFHELGHYGLVPPISRSIRGYEFDNVKERGYSFDPNRAKKLLAEAGYPNGEGFGSVTLRFNINELNSAVADEMAKQLNSVLNINVNIDGSSFDQLLNDYENGTGSMYKLSWSADFPNPETFLQLFYVESGEEKKNWAKYNNAVFNSFFEKARSSKKITEQLKFFNKAELALLEDPPMVILWYAGNYEITQSYVRNFYFNSLDFLDFTEVYIKPWTEEEYQKFLAEN